MKTLIASAALVLALAAPAYAQGGGSGCGNVNDPACSKSPMAPVGREAILGSIMLPDEPMVDYSGPLVLGEALPDTVMVYPVPRYDEYAFTRIGPRRVIIDRRTRRIVRLMDRAAAHRACRIGWRQARLTRIDMRKQPSGRPPKGAGPLLVTRKPRSDPDPAGSS